MLRSIRMNQILLLVYVLFAGQELVADGGTASRDQADAFLHFMRAGGAVKCSQLLGNPR
ncbi:MAG: hypothetical protein L7W43_12830 [Rubripirellula sp.]|nr:hypothetical protein [Rubripirellula sp.]